MSESEFEYEMDVSRSDEFSNKKEIKKEKKGGLMPDKLIKIIRALEEGDTRRIDGSFIDQLSQQKYLYKAYLMNDPPETIRIDIRRIK